MERISLREAADRTGRSVTTLRRYIRSGRLPADKLPGRFGPEYVVTVEQLGAAGLDIHAPQAAAHAAGAARAARDETGTSALAARVPSLPAPPPMAFERALRESVPITLFQDLQLKHEQLLVQYGMVRAGGLRMIDLQAELDARRRQVEDAEAENHRVKVRLAREAGELRKRLRETELELEGRRIEVAALREKVRALEMLTRNSVTNEAIERQFSHVMDQVRRVDRLTAEQEIRDTSPGAPWPPGGPHPEPEH